MRADQEPDALDERVAAGAQHRLAELWVDPELWRRVRDGIGALLADLHQGARPPDSPGAVRTSTTAWLFGMTPTRDPGEPPPP